MAHTPFRGKIPTDRLYDTRYDMWVQRAGERVVVGVTSFGVFLAGELIAFTAKPRGAQVELGRGIGTVESSKTVMAVHSPLSLLVDEINEVAEEHPRVINTDPYVAGWMVRGRPLAWENERAALVNARDYIAHVKAMEPDAAIEQ